MLSTHGTANQSSNQDAQVEEVANCNEALKNKTPAEQDEGGSTSMEEDPPVS